ncbi:MAG: [Ruminococcus sp.]|nr:[FeFe] hydrogenase H-cluster radical SAM maturase HydE [Ruminococcus sp.]
MRELSEIIDALRRDCDIPDDELKMLIEADDSEAADTLRTAADEVRRENYGTTVFLRGLIEISSFCKNDCLYCGIRRGNHDADRYRLDPEVILACADEGYRLGFRTFVLQGGEDMYFTDEVMCGIIRQLREDHPDCAITLSLGERTEESYRLMKEAGADRYLLRHEAASDELYSKLHPAQMSLENRKNCLYTLKRLGYQVGAGFMVGAPYQTTEHIIADLRFLQELRPQMIGIGPFVPHHSTCFAEAPGGTLQLTLRLLGILRLMHPAVLLPATTALGTISPIGRELGLKTGCNVVMPNLSPVGVRKKYDLYDNKICTGEEAAECRGCLQRRIESCGFAVAQERGDAVGFGGLDQQ